MTYIQYFLSQDSWPQFLDFACRILTASLCGFCIGFERTKRLKEAGVRTHVIVCAAAALLMIVSKYGFVDLTSPQGVNINGTRGADAARIAAQVVSGISFLCAGVIFKNGSIIKGLTTAAGIWATAGIGLAVGAGMYGMGLFTTLVLFGFQFVMHKHSFGADSLYTNHLEFTLFAQDTFPEEFEKYLKAHQIKIVESTISYENDGSLSYDITIKASADYSVHDWYAFLKDHGKVKKMKYTPLP